jgi:hypothetical protein
MGMCDWAIVFYVEAFHARGIYSLVRVAGGGLVPLLQLHAPMNERATSISPCRMVSPTTRGCVALLRCLVVVSDESHRDGKEATDMYSIFAS